MKFLTLLMVLSFLNVSFAQEPDYGGLVPGNFFEIKSSQTRLKENPYISNFEIKSTPKSEEFTYHINGVVTPKKLPGTKNAAFKLYVEKDEGKISRVSSVTYEKGPGHETQLAQSNTIDASGYVHSNTQCYDDYNIGLLGVKKNDSGQRCVTATKEVCHYVSVNRIDEDLVKQINYCSDVLKRLSMHQNNIREISQKAQKEDLKAISKLSGKTFYRNYSELDGKTINDVVEIVRGYDKMIRNCNYLKDNNYFAPDARVFKNFDQQNRVKKQ